MCGRFVFMTGEDRDEIMQKMPGSLGALKGGENINPKRGDIFPSQNAPVILWDESTPEIAPLKWGYENPFDEKKLLINARSETASERPMFREDMAERRCLIPATGFYEWSPEKAQFLFNDPGELLFLGGLWREKNGEREFVILTKEPDEIVSPVHKRMPVLISGEEAADWLIHPAKTQSLIKENPVSLTRTQLSGQKSFL